MKKYFTRSLKYNNVIEALQLPFAIKKITGVAIFEVGSDPKNGVVSKISWSGLVFFVIWMALYYFSAFRAFNENQTILRKFYDTRLKHYGDVFERIVSIAFVTYTMWKISFHINLSTGYLKKLIDIDNAIKRLGVEIDHSKDAFGMLVIALAQVIAGSTHLFSVWITLKQLEIAMPLEVLFQGTVTDALALVTTAHYCFFVRFLRDRYKIINDLLTEIKDRETWEQRVLVHSNKQVDLQIALLQYQDKYVCEKMKACARIYGSLFKAVESIQDMFGFSLLCTFLICLFYVVLYLFYFMEATASAGLIYDTQRYVYFLIYVFWQIVYTIGVIFLNIYFSEFAVKEAGRTSCIMHQIITSDIDPAITAQAMQFSIQLLHQIPVFTLCGLCRIDYMLLLQGSYSVVTFLVILLQFVMD